MTDSVRKAPARGRRMLVQGAFGLGSIGDDAAFCVLVTGRPWVDDPAT